MSAALEPIQGPPPFPRYALNPHSEHGLKHLWNQDRLHRPGRLDATTLQNNNVIAILRCQIHVMDRHKSGHTHVTHEFVAPSCEVAVGVAVAHPASSSRTKPTIAYITSLSYVLA